MTINSSNIRISPSVALAAFLIVLASVFAVSLAFSSIVEAQSDDETEIDEEIQNLFQDDTSGDVDDTDTDDADASGDTDGAAETTTTTTTTEAPQEDEVMPDSEVAEAQEGTPSFTG